MKIINDKLESLVCQNKQLIIDKQKLDKQHRALAVTNDNNVKQLHSLQSEQRRSINHLADRDQQIMALQTEKENDKESLQRSAWRCENLESQVKDLRKRQQGNSRTVAPKRAKKGLKTIFLRCKYKHPAPPGTSFCAHLC